jgi:hypothetical protein
LAQLVSLPVSRPQRPEKFSAVCRTCNISEVYHTELGARYFDLKHVSHDVEIEALEIPSEMNDLQSAEPALTEGIQHPDQQIEPTEQTPKTDSLDPATFVQEIVSGHDPVQELQTAKQATKLKTIPKQRRKLIAKKKVHKPTRTITTLPSLGRKDEAAELKHETTTIISSVSAYSDSSNPSQSQLVISKPAVMLQVKIEDQVENPAPLLLGKLSFIKEGEKHRVEAIRVSTALSELRWRIQPPYVIGALFDDILGVQSNTGAIGSDLISKLKELSYGFVAVEVPNGTVTAWFRKGSEIPNVTAS